MLGFHVPSETESNTPKNSVFEIGAAMPTDVNDLNLLRDYLGGVASRANHHAQNVHDVAPAVAGHIIMNKDDEPIKVNTRQGTMGNAIWVNIRNKRYAFGYDHTTQSIQIRDNSWQDPVRHSINNSTSHAQLTAIFASL